MGEGVTLVAVEFTSVKVTERTTWTFAEFLDEDGLKSVTEITCGDDTSRTAGLLPEMLDRARRKQLPPPGFDPGPRLPDWVA